MQFNKIPFATIVFLLAALAVSAQDIHFTQYNMSPMTLNPALVGKFEGTVRIGGIYRSQWTSLLGKKQYETPAVWADAPVIKGFRRNDWVGVGLSFLQDNSGSGILKHTVSKLGASYHLALNKKGSSVLSIGGHYGSEGYGVNDENLRFEDGIRNSNGGNYVASQSVDNQAIPDDGSKRNFSSFDLGVNFSSRLNKRMDFNIGYGMFYAGNPRFQSLLKSDTSSTPTSNFRQPRRSVLSGQFNIQTSDKITLTPSFIFQSMQGAKDEIIVQAMGGYLFNPEKDITLQAGLGYRLGDAANILLGAKIKDLRVGFAYDVNTSDLSSDTRFRGGFELAANYIIKIYKKAVVKPKVLCPRF